MAPIERPSRLYALMGKLETVPGTAETSFTSTDAILCVGKPEITFEPDNVDRNIALPWMGLSEQVPGTKRARIKFTTELVGSGAVATPPAWGRWLRGCGFLETINSGVSVKYSLINSGFEALTLRFNKSGVRYVGTGGRGTVDLALNAYGIPTATFEYLCFNTTAVEAAVPSVDLSNFIDPQVVNTENSGAFKLGSTINVDGTITGGTNLQLDSLSWSVGNKLVHRKLVDGEYIGISDRGVMGKAVVNLNTADEVQWRTDILSIATGSIAFTHGSTAGKKITISAPRAQRIDPQVVEKDGFDLMSVSLRALPGRAGAPELNITAL